jgi:hypothetical protein
MRFVTSAALVLLACSTPALGGKPSGGGGGSPSTTDPQVGYIHLLSNGDRELRLANEDGTGSALLLSTRSNILAFGLGPRAGHQVAYSDGSTIHLLTYEITSTGPVTRSNVTLVNLGTQKAPQLRFSPLGTQIVWLSGRNLYVYDVGSRQTQLLVQPHGDIGDFDFTHDGAQLFYSETDGVDPLTVQLRSVPIAGGPPTDVPVAGRYGDFRLGHTDLKIVADVMGNFEGQMSLLPADGSGPVGLTNGYHPALRCDDRMIIFQRRLFSGSRVVAVAVYKYDLTSGSTSTFSTKDNNTAEYFPDC